jgi:universal stress protein A
MKTNAPRSNTIELLPALIPIRSIVVPMDFSDVSRQGLAYGVRLAEQFGARLTVLHVLEPVAAPQFAAVATLVENEALRREARTRLEGVLREMKVPAKLVEKVLIRSGSPFAEITAAAKSLKADLIVLTTHGYTGLKHVFMGSTAERVVRHAHCPVLTVRASPKPKLKTQPSSSSSSSSRPQSKLKLKSKSKLKSQSKLRSGSNRSPRRLTPASLSPDDL